MAFFSVIYDDFWWFHCGYLFFQWNFLTTLFLAIFPKKYFLKRRMLPQLHTIASALFPWIIFQSKSHHFLHVHASLHQIHNDTESHFNVEQTLVIKRTRTFGFCRTELELELLSPNSNRTRTELFSNKKILFYPVFSTFNIFMGKNYEKNLRCKFVHRFSRFFPKKVSFSVQ